MSTMTHADQPPGAPVWRTSGHLPAFQYRQAMEDRAHTVADLAARILTLDARGAQDALGLLAAWDAEAVSDALDYGEGRAHGQQAGA